MLFTCSLVHLFIWQTSFFFLKYHCYPFAPPIGSDFSDYPLCPLLAVLCSRFPREYSLAFHVHYAECHSGIPHMFPLQV